jgi:hypothetical protein
VQDAVDAANDGDVIKVAAGTYTDVSARPRDDITTTGIVTQVVYRRQGKGEFRLDPDSPIHNPQAAGGETGWTRQSAAWCRQQCSSYG